MLQPDISLAGHLKAVCPQSVTLAEAEQRFFTLAGLNAALELAVLELMTCDREGTLDRRKARMRAAQAVQQNRDFYRKLAGG